MIIFPCESYPELSIIHRKIEKIMIFGWLPRWQVVVLPTFQRETDSVFINHLSK